MATPRPTEPPDAETDELELAPMPDPGAPHREPAEGVQVNEGPSPCPFLVAESGGWRSPVPSAEHRCGAILPSAALSRQKQARLCLTPAYPTCATYQASTEARRGRAGASASPEGPAVGRWALARTTVTLEPVTGMGVTVGGLLASRRVRQGLLAVVLIAAFVALASRWGDRDTAAIVTPEPTATEAVSSAPTPTPVETEIVITPEPTLPPTSEPTAAPTPAASYQTYIVKGGDTLYVIAQNFNTTVKKIMTLNNLTSTTLHTGQVLLIP